MDPLARIKVKTQAEKDALLKAAREAWDNVPDEHKHLVCASDEEYLSKIADGIVVEQAVFVPARALTDAELAEQNGNLLFSQIFGNRADDRNESTGCAAVDDLWKARQQSDLEKLLGPAKREQSALEGMVRKTVESVLVKGGHVPTRESEREPLSIAPQFAKAAEAGIVMERDLSEIGGRNFDEDSAISVLAAKFVKAHFAGDKSAMREVVRTLVAA